MPRTALAAAVTLALALPAAAQSMSVLLPVISLPEPIATPSTKGCGTLAPRPICVLQE